MFEVSEYQKRRRDLMNQIGSESVAIIPAAHEVTRSRDTHFRFRQDSDFSYLTGFPEPDAVAVLVPRREQGEYILFCRDKDRSREIWDGFRQGPDGARENFSADDAFPIDDIDDILPGLIEGLDKVYFGIGKHTDFDQKLTQWLNHIRAQSRTGASAPGEIIDPDHLLSEMRLIKSSEELKVMRKAGKISAEAHCLAMQVCQPGMYEYQLQAEIEYHFAKKGAAAPAYSSIVGSGANACVLHYIENSAKMNDGDLVLIDAGCEYQGYASDITRTFPVNGKFSGEQKAIYEIVLESQLAAIDACEPGRRFNEPHDASVRVITQGLKELGLLKGELDSLIESKAYVDFYMHRAGHWMGMDVHDVGDYKVDGANSEWREFEAGMVTTIEPGIYIHADNEKVDPRWRGIGVRIEDDVLIRRKGREILTQGVPKQIDDIESLMSA